ncbi:hypothetical protein BC941DRAFT_193738 [Chlamydoabsidia padenii]|nr:hypothetical protein BC941DRAFT_193738 [Chlamydoabsidia padenii]
MGGLLVILLHTKPDDSDWMEDEINTAIPDLSGKAVDVMRSIFMFFEPFVLSDVGEEEIDHHVLVNLFKLDACNAILQYTCYGRYCRKLMPHTSPATLHSLDLNTVGLYYASKQLLCRDITFADEQKIKNATMVSGKNVNEQARYALLIIFSIRCKSTHFTKIKTWNLTIKLSSPLLILFGSKSKDTSRYQPQN